MISLKCMNEELISKIREKALNDGVPIMEDEGINYVRQFLKDNDVKSLLEIGTAVGYSSIVFASYCPDLHITTVEIDQQRHQTAVKNIEEAGLTDRITAVLANAREFECEEKFDVLFLDGPKAHNQQLLERFEKNLKEDGIIIVDDVYFHGFLDAQEDQIGKRLKPLVKKFKKFREDMLNSDKYESEYLQIGDGVMICRRRKQDD